MSTPCRCGAVTIGQWRVSTADGMLHGVDECAGRERIITASWAWAPVQGGDA